MLFYNHAWSIRFHVSMIVNLSVAAEWLLYHVCPHLRRGKGARQWQRSPQDTERLFVSGNGSYWPSRGDSVYTPSHSLTLPHEPIHLLLHSCKHAMWKDVLKMMPGFSFMEFCRMIMIVSTGVRVKSVCIQSLLYCFTKLICHFS